MKKSRILISLIIFLFIISLASYTLYNYKKEKAELIILPELKFNKRFLPQVGKIDINKSNLIDLEKHLNNKLANAIIEYRSKNGVIKNIDNLIKIGGVGYKTVEKLKENFYVEESFKSKSVYINGEVKELYNLPIKKRKINKIIKYRKDNGSIYDMETLISIIGKKDYYLIRDSIVY